MSQPDNSVERKALLAGRLTHLRLELALVMQELRDSAGCTQSDLATRLGVKQPAVAKLERAGDHKIESVMRYLAEFDADLLVAVKQGDDVVQVSHDEEHLLVALPREVDDWAAKQGKGLDEFVLEAVREAHRDGQHYNLSRNSGIIQLLAEEYDEYASYPNSDDPSSDQQAA